MELVVDANILIAGLLRRSVTRELLLDERLTLWTPEHNLMETERALASSAFRKRLGDFSTVEVRALLGFVTSKIGVLPASSYQRHFAEALRLAPHPEDAPYLALAMHLHIPLWSNDAALKNQHAVQVYATHELLKLLA